VISLRAGLILSDAIHGLASAAQLASRLDKVTPQVRRYRVLRQ
jgi:hypothetical protein